jgi:hypothetical protein
VTHGIGNKPAADEIDSNANVNDVVNEIDAQQKSFSEYVDLLDRAID